MKGIDERKVAAIDVLFYLHVHMCLAHAFKKLQHKTMFNRKHICTLYGVWMELTKGNIHILSVYLNCMNASPHQEHHGAVLS